MTLKRSIWVQGALSLLFLTPWISCGSDCGATTTMSEVVCYADPTSQGVVVSFGDTLQQLESSSSGYSCLTCLNVSPILKDGYLTMSASLRAPTDTQAKCPLRLHAIFSLRLAETLIPDTRWILSGAEAVESIDATLSSPSDPNPDGDCEYVHGLDYTGLDGSVEILANGSGPTGGYHLKWAAHLKALSPSAEHPNLTLEIETLCSPQLEWHKVEAC